MVNICDLKYDEIINLAKDIDLLKKSLIDNSNKKNTENTTDDCSNNIFPIGKYVIVRTFSAGVHFGILDECEGMILRLKKSRRIWKWSDAFTLSEISNNGVGKDSKISEPVEEIILTQAIEIIPCSKKSIKIIEEIEPYKP